MAISWDAVSGSEYYPSYVQHPSGGPPVQYNTYMKVVKPSSITWSWDPKGGAELPAMPVRTPYVAWGSHRVRRIPGIGCTMELVSALAGEAWTDHPRTAHPTLTRLMINTNDVLPDDERQKMLELVPRLLNTNVPLDWELENLMHRDHEQMHRIADSVRISRHLVDPITANHLLHNARHLLDEFDKRLNRPTRKMDDQTLTRLMTALAA